MAVKEVDLGLVTGPAGPQGPQGPAGSDANVQSITTSDIDALSS